jgi:hypothetical protein
MMVGCPHAMRGGDSNAKRLAWQNVLFGEGCEHLQKRMRFSIKNCEMFLESYCTHSIGFESKSQMYGAGSG